MLMMLRIDDDDDHDAQDGDDDEHDDDDDGDDDGDDDDDQAAPARPDSLLLLPSLFPTIGSPCRTPQSQAWLRRPGGTGRCRHSLGGAASPHTSLEESKPSRFRRPQQLQACHRPPCRVGCQRKAQKRQSTMKNLWKQSW